MNDAKNQRPCIVASLAKRTLGINVARWYGAARCWAQRQTKKNMRARITATVQKSNAAIFRNIQPPTTPKCVLASRATFCNIQRRYHWKRHNCQRRYVLKYLHLGLNREAQLTLNSRAQLALRSGAHLGPGGRRHKHGGMVSVSDRGRITLVRVGSHARHLALLKLGRIAPVGRWNQHATSGLLLRPPPVGDA
jgi:hypothetical protein